LPTLRRCVGSTDAKEASFYLSLDKDALIVVGAPQRLHSAIVQVVGKLSTSPADVGLRGFSEARIAPMVRGYMQHYGFCVYGSPISRPTSLGEAVEIYPEPRGAIAYFSYPTDRPARREGDA
jgi:hypothetical protein